MSKPSLRSGSLMRPFQATVVRGFSKYTPHDDQQVVAQLRADNLEAGRIIQGRLRIMDRARTGR